VASGYAIENGQLLQKLYSIKQDRQESMIEYVRQLHTLYNWLNVQSRPAQVMLVNWFIASLHKDFRGVLANSQEITN